MKTSIFFKKKKKLENKITILSLHLGYGGIERSIVNQANMLSRNYKVEIVSLYKLKNECNYKLNRNIRVIYLSHLEPNKKAFIKSLQKRNVFKILIEGFKSIYILLKKYTLISKYIYNSNSKVIISTRLNFTKSLGRFGNKNCIKIAEEHVYHCNNIKYINKLKKAMKNVNYLIPASKYLTDDYKKFFGTSETKVVYIPQTIDYLPNKINDLSNKNIIFVGRLEKEKGIADLLVIFKKINDQHKDIKLTIVGDGALKQFAKEYISDNCLNDSVILKGYLSGELLRKEYEKASLFLMTSYEESFGLVLIEAMSYGIPCFAFSSALGAQEIINCDNGLIITSRDKEKMATEIIKYFKFKNKNIYGKSARKTSEKYFVDKIANKWLNFISELLIK